MSQQTLSPDNSELSSQEARNQRYHRREVLIYLFMVLVTFCIGTYLNFSGVHLLLNDSAQAAYYRNLPIPYDHAEDAARSVIAGCLTWLVTMFFMVMAWWKSAK